MVIGNPKLTATGLKTIRGALERLEKEGMRNWQDEVAKELVAEIKKTAPKDTGKYAQQWKIRRRNNLTKFKTVIHISVGKKKLPGNYQNKTYQDLFNWLEFQGTKPHHIYPVRARALHWVKNGVDYFSQHVYHPGTKPTPHVRPAMRRILPRSMQRAIKGINDRHIWLKR